MTYENRCWRSSAILMRSIPCSPKTGYNFPHLSDISVRSSQSQVNPSNGFKSCSKYPVVEK